MRDFINRILFAILIVLYAWLVFLLICGSMYILFLFLQFLWSVRSAVLPYVVISMIIFIVAFVLSINKEKKL
jgi:hypothetical protein